MAEPRLPARSSRSLRGLLLAVLVLLVAVPADADVITKQDGTQIIGKVIKQERDRVQILIKRGTMEAHVWIPKEDIHKIEIGDLPQDEFQKRLEALKPHDLDGHVALQKWAEKKRLRDGARRIERLLPEVRWRHLKATNLRTWCRGCDARGEVRCGECAGKGKVVEPCIRCQGEGTIPCRVCGDKETPGVLRCRKCSGGGQIQRFNPAKGRKETVQCPDCRGKGERACPTCKGKVRQACPHCEGKKGIAQKCPRCAGKPTEKCLVCGGGCLQPEPVTDEQLAAEEAARKAREEAQRREKEENEKKAAEKDGKKTGKSPTSKPADAGRSKSDGGGS